MISLFEKDGAWLDSCLSHSVVKVCEPLFDEVRTQSRVMTWAYVWGNLEAPCMCVCMYVSDVCICVMSSKHRLEGWSGHMWGATVIHKVYTDRQTRVLTGSDIRLFVVHAFLDSVQDRQTDIPLHRQTDTCTYGSWHPRVCRSCIPW